MKLYVGCSGWSYSSWDGHFYPKGTESNNYLQYYSKVFDYVEIDSTFYRMPDRFTTLRWSKLTPDSFRFTAKFPQEITHEKRLAAQDKILEFFEVMRPLKDKLLALLIQLPPSLTMREGRGNLERLIELLDSDFRYALQVRHGSWFDKKFYKFLSENDICLAWSQLETIRTPPELTTDFAYIRLIGDRSIDEKDFARVQKNRRNEMEVWASRLKMAEKKISLAIAAVNNHYAGFAPATVNGFRKLLGQPEAMWDEI